MKKLSIKKGVQCMACLECVRACSNAYYKEFHPDTAALKIVQRGENVRPMVCVQCGKCAEVCPAGAAGFGLFCLLGLFCRIWPVLAALPAPPSFLFGKVRH